MISKNFKKIFFTLAFLGLVFSLYKMFFENKRIFSQNSEYIKIALLNIDGLTFKTSTSANLVSDFLKEKNITLGEHDQIIPELDSKILSGSKIEIQRARSIEIEVDGKTIQNHTLSKKIAEVLRENDVSLSRLDQVSPNLSHPPNETIIVTRINVEEKVEEEEIDFKVVVKKDSKLGWQEKKIEQKGKVGIMEVKYKITYENGEEISRIVLEKNKTKEPLEQIETQGTYMKLGKAKRGEASHYASSWGNLNASRDIPRGGYAKVTNMENGKSTVVKINDYGPQSPSRIIDLSYVAFTQIASSGQGIAHNVKVEEILN